MCVQCYIFYIYRASDVLFSEERVAVRAAVMKRAKFMFLLYNGSYFWSNKKLANTTDQKFEVSMFCFYRNEYLYSAKMHLTDQNLKSDTEDKMLTECWKWIFAITWMDYILKWHVLIVYLIKIKFQKHRNILPQSFECYCICLNPETM